MITEQCPARAGGRLLKTNSVCSGWAGCCFSLWEKKGGFIFMLTTFQAIPGRADFCLKLGVVALSPKTRKWIPNAPFTFYIWHLRIRGNIEYRCRCRFNLSSTQKLILMEKIDSHTWLCPLNLPITPIFITCTDSGTVNHPAQVWRVTSDWEVQVLELSFYIIPCHQVCNDT